MNYLVYIIFEDDKDNPAVIRCDTYAEAEAVRRSFITWGKAEAEIVLEDSDKSPEEKAAILRREFEQFCNQYGLNSNDYYD